MLTAADIAELRRMADASCGRPGDLLTRACDWIEARRAKEDRTIHLMTETRRILAQAEARYCVQLPRDVRFRSKAAMAAKRWAVGEMRALGMSAPEIARAIGLRSHAGVLHLLGRWGARKAIA